jgi:hypothetical protein
MPEDHVTVPPGHKVVVIHPVAAPSLGQMESGLVIANLGAGDDFEPVLSAAERVAATGHQLSMIWILQEALLTQVTDWDQFVGRLESVVRKPGNRIGHCVVLVLEAAQRHALVQRLKGVGMGVHGSADDGACVVEVHRPDGIVVGMPGRAL